MANVIGLIVNHRVRALLRKEFAQIRRDRRLAISLVLPPTLQRAVLANITLPLERQRLVALVQHVAERVRTTGRRRDTPPERHAP